MEENAQVKPPVQTVPSQLQPSQANTPSPKSKMSVILGTVVLLLVAGIAGAFVMGAKNIKPIAQITPLPTMQPSITPKPTIPINLCSAVSYTAPTGWKETKDSYGCPTITSPDYVSGQSGMIIPSGMLILISAGIVNSNPTLDSFAKELGNTAGVSNIQKTTIAGFPAVKYQVKYEGFYDKYAIFKDGVEYFITLQYGGNTDQEVETNRSKYTQQINIFLQSIKLTNQNQMIDTSHWKTFNGKNYTFQYPSDWILQKDSYQLFGEWRFTFANTDKSYKFTTETVGRGFVDPNKSNVYQNTQEKKTINGNLVAISTTTLNGKSYYLSASIQKASLNDDLGIYIPPTNSQNYINTFNQILSTFKFTQ